MLEGLVIFLAFMCIGFMLPFCILCIFKPWSKYKPVAKDCDNHANTDVGKTPTEK